MADDDNSSSQEIWSSQLASLERDGRISLSWLPAALDWIMDAMPRDGIHHVVDAGAGVGSAACAISQQLPLARVTALEPEPVLFRRTEDRIRELGLDARASAVLGDIQTGLADIQPADLIWCSHVLHHLDDPVAGIATLGDTLTPGGLLAVVEGGLPMRVLPGGYGVGDPSLVTRLESQMSDFYSARWHMPITRGDADWPLLIRDAGYQHLGSRTFLTDFPAPLDRDIREHIVDHFTAVLAAIGDGLTGGDRAALERLVDLDDPASLENREDVFLLAATTVHLARPSSRTKA